MKKIIFKGEYFYMDATIFEKDLSANAVLVYGYLCKCADKTGHCWPSHRTIAQACSLSVTTVKQALRELEERQIVSVLPRYRAQGGKTSNLYRISKTFGRVCAAGAQIFAAEISCKAKLVYIHLCKCADKQGISWPSHRTIARWCAIGISTVRRALAELAEAAIVAITERRRGDNGQTSNLYQVLQIVKTAFTAAFRHQGQGYSLFHMPGRIACCAAVTSSGDTGDVSDSRIIAPSPGDF